MLSEGSWVENKGLSKIERVKISPRDWGWKKDFLVLDTLKYYKFHNDKIPALSETVDRKTFGNFDNARNRELTRFPMLALREREREGENAETKSLLFSPSLARLPKVLSANSIVPRICVANYGKKVSLRCTRLRINLPTRIGIFMKAKVGFSEKYYSVNLNLSKLYGFDVLRLFDGKKVWNWIYRFIVVWVKHRLSFIVLLFNWEI